MKRHIITGAFYTLIFILLTFTLTLAVTIDQLTETTNANNSDKLPITQGGSTKKISKSNLLKGKLDASEFIAYTTTVNDRFGNLGSGTGDITYPQFSLHTTNHTTAHRIDLKADVSRFTRYSTAHAGEAKGVWGFITGSISSQTDLMSQLGSKAPIGHTTNFSNPHQVSATQVGKDTSQWNADRLRGRFISTTAPQDGQVYVWNSYSSAFLPRHTGAGGSSSWGGITGVLDNQTDLSARLPNDTQKGYLTSMEGGVLTSTVLQNSLDSTLTTKALTAAQGKVLQDNKVAITDPRVIKTANYLDAKSDFGCVGDGTATDTVPIFTAISSASMSNKTIKFSNGTFKTAGGYQINRPVNIVCENAKFVLSANTTLFDISSQNVVVDGCDVKVPDANTAPVVQYTAVAGRFCGRGWGPLYRDIWRNSRIYSASGENWTSASGYNTTGSWTGFKFLVDSTGSNCGIDFIEVEDTWVMFPATGIYITETGANSGWFNGNMFKNVYIGGFTTGVKSENIRFSGNEFRGLSLHHVRSTDAVGVDLDANAYGNHVWMNAWNDSGGPTQTPKSNFQSYNVDGWGNDIVGYAEDTTATPNFADPSNHIVTTEYNHTSTASTYNFKMGGITTDDTGYAFEAYNGDATKSLKFRNDGTLLLNDVSLTPGSSTSISQLNTSVEVVDAGDGYIKFTEDGSEVARISGGSLGVGITPSYPMHLRKEFGTPASTNIMFTADSFGDTPRFLMRRANGTIATPTMTLATNNLAAFGGRGYNGSAHASFSTGQMTVYSAENTNTGWGTGIRLYTTRTGHPEDTAATVRMDINAAGNVSLGDETYSSTCVDKLCVNGTANFASTVTATGFTGNASSATALAANGTNCSSGQAPLGVDANGNAEGCWTVPTHTQNTDTTLTVGNTSVTVADTGTDGNISLKTENVERIHITPAGFIGINTSTPQYSVDSYSTSASGAKIMSRTEATSVSGGGMFVAAHNSDKSGNYFVAPNSGDRLGGLFFGSMAGTEAAFTQKLTALINGVTETAWEQVSYCRGSGTPYVCCTGVGTGTGCSGSETTGIVFQTTGANGATRSEKMRISGNGNIQFQQKINQMSGSKALTNSNTFYDMVQVDLGDGQGTAVSCRYNFVAADASTNVVYHAGDTRCIVYRNGATASGSCTEGTEITQQLKGTGATLASDDFQVVNSSGNARIQAKITYAGLTPTTFKVDYDCSTIDPVTLTPQ